MNGFLILACMYVALAFAFGLRARATRKSWGEWIPCTGTADDAFPVLIAVAAVAVAVALGLSAIRPNMPAISGVSFAAFFVGVSVLVAGIGTMVKSDRVGGQARVWLSLAHAGVPKVRADGVDEDAPLSPGDVSYYRVGLEMRLIQYRIRQGSRTMNLVVGTDIRTRFTIESGGFLNSYLGAVVQTRHNEVHAFLAPYLRHENAETS